MDIADPSALITAGHRLAESGARLGAAAAAVPPPELGHAAALVPGRVEGLVAGAHDLADRLTDVGDDLAFAARTFVMTDGHVGSVIERVLLSGRFA